MQSTGQGATQSSQPVHSAPSTVCMRFAAPTIASTGHFRMQIVQPMQAASSISATRSGPGSPRVRSTGRIARPAARASAAAPSSPPGGQRSMSASPRAIASA